MRYINGQKAKAQSVSVPSDPWAASCRGGFICVCVCGDIEMTLNTQTPSHPQLTCPPCWPGFKHIPNMVFSLFSAQTIQSSADISHKPAALLFGKERLLQSPDLCKQQCDNRHKGPVLPMALITTQNWLQIILQEQICIWKRGDGTSDYWNNSF